MTGSNLMGRMKRFELSTSGTTNQRSNQLSYIRHRQQPTLHIIRFKVKLKITTCSEKNNFPLP